jgi:FkbM family methyltransferase
VTDTALPVDTWIERNVELPNGSRHVMVVDTASDDSVTQLYLTGSGVWLNAFLVRVMLATVQPGDRVVDLGAFAGDFALAAAANGCDVLAVEANPTLAEMVRYSAELSQFEALRVVNAAIGDAPGSVEFMSNGPWGQVRPDPTGAGDVRFAPVPQVTVDDLLEALSWDAVAFMKVDVEGSEIRALTGATRLLSASNAPALLVESNISRCMEDGTQPRALLEMIEGFGYSLHRVMPDEIVRCHAGDFQAETVADYLALKERTPADLGLVAREPLSLSETAARVLSEARHETEAHRRSIGWQLQFAAPELLEHPDVQQALRLLREDSHEDVRAAVLAPIAPADTASASSAADGRWLTERVLRESADARAAVVHRLNGWGRDTASSTAAAEVWPGPVAMQVARRLSASAERHPWLATFARRLIQIAGRTTG